MTFSGSIFKYYLRQQSNIEDYLMQCVAHAEPEAVHQLRLCIKKLRAFNILAMNTGLRIQQEHMQQNFSMKKMFKLAGQIRDTQVQIQMLDAYEQKVSVVFPEFSDWLLKREKKRISKLCDQAGKRVAHVTTYNELQAMQPFYTELNDKLMTDAAVDLLNRMYTKAQKLSTGYISNENLHSIRKIAKQLKYILNILISCYPEFYFDRIPISALREIDVVAGHWHDHLLRIDLLGTWNKKMQVIDDQTKQKYKEFADYCNASLGEAYDQACAVVKSNLFEQV
jgi:CHAD domain-containing protein